MSATSADSVSAVCSLLHASMSEQRRPVEATLAIAGVRRQRYDQDYVSKPYCSRRSEITHPVLDEEWQQSIPGAAAMRSGRGLRLRRLAGPDGVGDPAMLGGRRGRQVPQMQGEQARAVGLVTHRGRDAGQPSIAASLGQELVEALVGGGPAQQVPALQGLLHSRRLA